MGQLVSCDHSLCVERPPGWPASLPGLDCCPVYTVCSAVQLFGSACLVAPLVLAAAQRRQGFLAYRRIASTVVSFPGALAASLVNPLQSLHPPLELLSLLLVETLGCSDSGGPGALTCFILSSLWGFSKGAYCQRAQSVSCVSARRIAWAAK